MSKLIEKWKTEHKDPKGVSDALYGFERTLKTTGKGMLYEALNEGEKAFLFVIVCDLLKMEAGLHEEQIEALEGHIRWLKEGNRLTEELEKLIKQEESCES